LGLVIGGGAFFTLLLFVALVAMVAGGGGEALGPGPRIAVVEVLGPIQDSKQAVEQLREFREDGEIVAVVVRVNSPGGAVAPSQEIHDAIARTRALKPVVVSMGQTAASGGYYLAVAANEIVANRGTLTGSIGVITQLTNFSALAELAKVEMVTITSGPMKDAGNPFRPMSDTERALFQDMVMDIYDQFLGDVAEGRGLEVDAVRPFADGRVLTGRQAHEAGLVDHLGGFELALERALELAGVSGPPALVYPEPDKEGLLMRLIAGGARSAARGIVSESAAALSEGKARPLWQAPGL